MNKTIILAPPSTCQPVQLHIWLCLKTGKGRKKPIEEEEADSAGFKIVPSVQLHWTPGAWGHQNDDFIHYL